MNFAATLLQWFKNNGRSLPWRETKDAYAIWLSEVILQQTRIVQGMSLKYSLGNDPHIALASSVLLLVPGFPLINSLADILKGYVNMGYKLRGRKEAHHGRTQGNSCPRLR